MHVEILLKQKFLTNSNFRSAYSYEYVVWTQEVNAIILKEDNIQGDPRKI